MNLHEFDRVNYPAARPRSARRLGTGLGPWLCRDPCPVTAVMIRSLSLPRSTPPTHPRRPSAPIGPIRSTRIPHTAP
jgi:hypothetical protein